MHVKIVIATEYCNRNLCVKKGNIYSVNTVNIENTVSTVNTANNKNNILTSLTLPMDRSLLVESTLQIDFENTQDEDDLDKTSRKGYVDYSERNFTDLFNIPDYNNNDKDQHSSCSEKESDTGTNEKEADQVPLKRGKENITQNGQLQNQNQN